MTSPADYHQQQCRAYDLRPIAAVEHDYHGDNEIYLKLDQRDLIALSISLKETLGTFGIMMSHEDIIEAPNPSYHPTSHIGKLVALYRRVDAALHGRHTWNAEWRELPPHCDVKRVP